MVFIGGREIQKALTDSYRVYLCGDLKKPQDLQWIHDDRNELGISYYKQFTADQPHYHTTATEYNYVISGKSKIYLIDERKELLLETGSVFVLPPMTKYASKHFDNTTIIFFKSPGGNDKQLIDVDGKLKDWLSAW